MQQLTQISSTAQSQKKAEEKCHLHQGTVIALDMQNQVREKQGLCVKCLVDKNQQYQLLQDIQTKITQKKEEVKQNRDKKNQSLVDSLKGLVSKLIELKNLYDQSIGKLTGVIEQWSTSLIGEKENFDKSLDDINTDYMDQFVLELNTIVSSKEENHQTYKKLIQNSLDQILQYDHFKQCQQMVQQIEDYKNDDQEFDYEPEIEEKAIPERTPKLNLICEEHQTEIIMLDLNENRPIENRLGCVYCGCKTKRKYKPLKAVQEKWETYQKEKCDKLNNYKKAYGTKVDQLKSSLLSLKNAFINKIDETTKFLNENFIKVSNNVQVQLNQMSNDWATFSKEQAVQIAELLSKRQPYEIGEDCIKLECEIITFINDSLGKLKLTETHLLEKISKQIQLNEQFETLITRYLYINKETMINDSQISKQIRQGIIQK